MRLSPGAERRGIPSLSSPLSEAKGSGQRSARRLEGTMGIEPFAQKRLQRVWATTRDPILRRELSATLEELEMPFVPSPELLRQISNCPGCEHQDARVTREGLCETHRSRWNLELCSTGSFTDDGDA